MSTIEVVALKPRMELSSVLCHDPATATVDGLQERVHATVSYALDGQLAETFPDVAGRPVSIRLDSPACNVDLNASSGVAHAIRDPDRVAAGVCGKK